MLANSMTKGKPFFDFFVTFFGTHYPWGMSSSAAIQLTQFADQQVD
jgi:hypothetical protein